MKSTKTTYVLGKDDIIQDNINLKDFISLSKNDEVEILDLIVPIAEEI